MKKKATSSSSNRASFESLQEAKDSVDQSFEELLKQLDEFYKAIDPFWSGVFFGPRHGQIISLRIDPNSIETKKTVLENSKERLHKLDQAILHSCSNICLFDAFNENGKFFLWLAEHQENWIRYLQAILDQFLDKQKKESDDLIYILPPGRILPSEIKERAEHVRKTIINGLPGFLAFQNSLTTNKPKKSRSPEAIQKGKDLLYLLDQYESWKAKTAEKTRKKRLNSKDWLECRKQWPEKTEKLFVKYADQLLDDEIEIENLLDNARKYRKRA